MDLSLNLKAVVSQRLVKKGDDSGRLPAVEVMLNTPLMADLIHKGDIAGMKTLIAKSNNLGMCTFDQALFRLIDSKMISVTEGLRNADSVNDLRLQLKLNSRQAKKGDFFKGTEGMVVEAIEDVPHGMG
jgi:twitching motility protein PilU